MAGEKITPSGEEEVTSCTGCGKCSCPGLKKGVDQSSADVAKEFKGGQEKKKKSDSVIFSHLADEDMLSIAMFATTND